MMLKRIPIILSLFLLSCRPTPQPTFQTAFYIYRFNPPALIEFAEDFQPINEIPFSIPPHCGLFNIFPAPIGRSLAIELSCPNGQTVLYLDTNSTFISQPITDTDSHFLAWTPDGQAAYLKIDSLGNARVIRAGTNGKHEEVEIHPGTYDLSARPNSGDFTFTFSRGFGYGSEIHLTQYEARNTQQLYSDPYNYISFARWSPDGSHIAFIKIPDSPTPFTVGELWLIDANGSNARKLADADAGHGYAANWSPDGTKIAFVVRENPEDERANQSSDSLISNIYVLEVESGELTQFTHLEKGHAETPFWSHDGNTLAFNEVVDGRIEVRIADLGRIGSSEGTDSYRDPVGEIRSLITESACCPAWMRK
jgi:Tol biopolymer transport system component